MPETSYWTSLYHLPHKRYLSLTLGSILCCIPHFCCSWLAIWPKDRARDFFSEGGFSRIWGGSAPPSLQPLWGMILGLYPLDPSLCREDLCGETARLPLTPKAAHTDHSQASIARVSQTTLKGQAVGHVGLSMPTPYCPRSLCCSLPWETQELHLEMPQVQCARHLAGEPKWLPLLDPPRLVKAEMSNSSAQN